MLKNFIKKNFPRIFSRLREIFYVIFIPPPTSIAIEINSFCNRKCRFCPNFNHTREKAFLEEELFYKIIQDLRSMKFKGALTFNMFNEPLLDKRLIKFIAYAKRKLSSIRIEINTNGDLLDLSLFYKLKKSGVDFINVTQYDGKINENIQRILDALNSREKKNFYAHTLDIICNRAGTVKVNSNVKLPLRKFCRRPFYQLCINYEGKAVLCCNDYFGLVETGDLRKNSTSEIWRSKIFKHYRWHLFLRDRAHLKLCDKCDM